MGESQTIKTMIHEVAHAMLHNSDFMKQRGEEKDRLTKETEAESIAFTVCSALGIDTSDYSFPYVASWASGKEMKELNSNSSRREVGRIKNPIQCRVVVP